VVTLKLEPGAEHAPGKLIITATAAEVGEHQTVCEGMISGEGGQILLNIGYVVDALQAMTTPQLTVDPKAYHLSEELHRIQVALDARNVDRADQNIGAFLEECGL
jgi:hypothetical protein